MSGYKRPLSMDAACPECGKVVRRDHLARHRATHRQPVSEHARQRTVIVVVGIARWRAP